MVDRILVPIDASESAERALRFGAELARRYDASLEVVHFTDVETEATHDLLEHARAILEEEDIGTDPAVEHDLRLTFKASDRIGQDILDLVEEEGDDHRRDGPPRGRDRRADRPGQRDGDGRAGERGRGDGHSVSAPC